MSDRKRVNLVVSAEQKAKWDSAVEESPEYSSLSDLIRKSVAHELSEPQEPARGDTDSERRERSEFGELTEMKERLSRMENTLESVERDVNTVAQEVTGESLTNIRNEIFDVLPAPSEAGQSEQEIIQAVNGPADKVRSELPKLAETPLVTTTETDGTTYYNQGEDL